MRPQVQTTSDASGGAVNSTAAPVDYKQVPFSVGFACVVTGTATYTVQHTFDDFLNPANGFTAATANWFDHEFVTGKSANDDGNYSSPVFAIRLRQTAGNGSVRMTILQGEQR